MQFLIPIIVHAQDSVLSIKELMFRVSYYIINPIIVLGFVIALGYFIWGMIDFLANRDTSSQKAEEGKQHMLYGTIGMFIMVSAFAIMRLLASAIGADNRILSELP